MNEWSVFWSETIHVTCHGTDSPISSKFPCLMPNKNSQNRILYRHLQMIKWHIAARQNLLSCPKLSYRSQSTTFQLNPFLALSSKWDGWTEFMEHTTHLGKQANQLQEWKNPNLFTLILGETLNRYSKENMTYDFKLYSYELNPQITANIKMQILHTAIIHNYSLYTEITILNFNTTNTSWYWKFPARYQKWANYNV